MGVQVEHERKSQRVGETQKVRDPGASQEIWVLEGTGNIGKEVNDIFEPDGAVNQSFCPV